MPRVSVAGEKSYPGRDSNNRRPVILSYAMPPGAVNNTTKGVAANTVAAFMTPFREETGTLPHTRELPLVQVIEK
jgi:hypothetical protein